MKINRIATAVAASLLALAWLASPASGGGGSQDDDDLRFRVRVEAGLDGAQEVSPVDTEMTGEIELRIRNNRLRFELEVEDNSHDIVAAHIHCAAPGVNGPVGVTVFSGSFTDEDGRVAKGRLDGPDDGNRCGWADLADVAAAVLSGQAYVNVHTSAASGGVPSGEIRGDLG